ncbi:MAG: hypothetical protein EBV69_13580 [Oxalobacteraceae bacterium]|nr:hypothetical protein [Oxalobacteraceae bacterium]
MSTWIYQFGRVNTCLVFGSLALCIWYCFQIAPFMVHFSKLGESPFAVISSYEILIMSIFSSPTAFALLRWDGAPKLAKRLAAGFSIGLGCYLAYLFIIALIALML